MSTSDDVLTGFGFFVWLVFVWLFGWQVSTSVKLEQKNENLFFFGLTQIQIGGGEKFQSILSSSSLFSLEFFKRIFKIFCCKNSMEKNSNLK